MRKRKRFDYLHVETALCLWEAFLEFELCERQQEAACAERRWQELHDEHGSFELRRIVHELAIPAGKMWDKTLTADERQAWTFDWEFCPLFLMHAVDWRGEWRDGDNGSAPKVFKDGWERMKAHAALAERFAPRIAA